MAKVNYVLVEQEYSANRKALFVIKADSPFIVGTVIDEVVKTKENKKSEYNGRPVNKFVSKKTGKAFWVYSDYSVMR